MCSLSLVAITGTIGGLLFSLASVKYVCSVFDNDLLEETIKISVKNELRHKRVTETSPLVLN